MQIINFTRWAPPQGGVGGGDGSTTPRKGGGGMKVKVVIEETENKQHESFALPVFSAFLGEWPSRTSAGANGVKEGPQHL